MKKRLILLVSALTVLFLVGLTACGGSGSGESSDGGADYSDSPYVGEWIAEDVSLGDNSESLSDEFVMTINADGTGTLIGADETSEFTWTPTENGFKTAGDMKMKFKADGEDTLRCKLLGASLNFVRAYSETAKEDSEKAAEAVNTPGIKYGYTGDDPAVAAVYEYLATDIAANYVPGRKIVSVPAVRIVNEEEGAEGTTDIYGDFWIYNYKIKGKTLKCVSGGNHPGVIHVAQDGDAYKVTGFDQVADGGKFESSAREIFGDDYDAFMKIYSDDDSNEKERATTLAAYVEANGLDVTKYKDYGWDPVDLPL